MKNVRYVLFIIIILGFVFGCMSLKSDSMHRNVDNYYAKKIDEKYKTGIDNFAFLFRVDFLLDGCKDLISEDCPVAISSTASGLVFSNDKNSIFVLTAAHFCSNSNPERFESKIIGFVKDFDRELYVIRKDEENDLCLLMGVKYEHETFNQIKIAKNEPALGSDVYTVAAPNSMGGPGLRLVFTGKFGGCDEKNCMTTIPATFGSSGAGVYNKKGELITIVMAVTQDFENLIISPTRISLLEFIKNIDKDIDIYD